jgi:hypothetical protein
VRLSLERPDDITASAVTAREEISRAVADKIRNLQTAEDVKTVVQEVLPEIEKFLESPEQRRLRRIRGGVITSMTGIGAAILSLLVVETTLDVELIHIMMGGVGLGITAFLIGLGVIFNAFFFTLPRQQVPTPTLTANDQTDLDARQVPTSQLIDSGSSLPVASITEHTTQHLSSKRS